MNFQNIEIYNSQIHYYTLLYKYFVLIQMHLLTYFDYLRENNINFNCVTQISFLKCDLIE